MEHTLYTSHPNELLNKLILLEKIKKIKKKILK